MCNGALEVKGNEWWCESCEWGSRGMEKKGIACKECGREIDKRLESSWCGECERLEVVALVSIAETERGYMLRVSRSTGGDVYIAVSEIIKDLLVRVMDMRVGKEK